MSWQKDEALRKRYAALQDLFAEYYEREKANLFGPADDGALEARDRLRQLVHIVTRLEDLQTFRDSHPNDQDRDKWTEMEVYTEAFYWIAFRLRQVVKNLPELGSFKFTGVRNVRNHLIEHPEGGDSGITFGNIGIRSDVGPVVRVVRRTGQLDRWMDAGLKPNALECGGLGAIVAQVSEAHRLPCNLTQTHHPVYVQSSLGVRAVGR